MIRILRNRVAAFAFVTAALFVALSFAFSQSAMAQTLSEDIESTSGVAFDRTDAYESTDSSESASTADSSESASTADSSESASTADSSESAVTSDLSGYDGIMALSATSGPSVSRMTLSDEMLYFCKYESNRNYAQELSYGDGYHAMGYFQFDNRYGLGDFLHAVYNSNPGKYCMLEQLGDWYGWDLSANGKDVRYVASRGGGNWSMADDMNWSWREAYKADPSEFSEFQNGWAYTGYYVPARSYIAARTGLNLDTYADCVRGMAWGMCNLFGSSGWRKWVDNAGLTANMNSAQVASSLANALIGGIEDGTYRYTYGTSYVNRYRHELDDCLAYLGKDINTLARDNEGSIANGVYSIRLALAPGKVIDVQGGLVDDGANVQLYGSNDTNAQRWRVTNVGGGYITLTNVGSGKVLDVSAGVKRRGADVQQWTGNSTNAQKWVAVRDAGGSYTLYSALGQGLVLDVAGGSTENGTGIQIFSDNASGAQKFTFRNSLDDEAAAHKNDLANGTYLVASSLSSAKLLDVSAGSHSNGADVQLYACNNTNAQRWRVTHDASGYVTLTNVRSGKVLDVAGGVAVNAQNVQQYAANGSDAQKWVAIKGPSGSYTLKSKLNNGMVLDVARGSYASGTNVQIFEGNGSAAQAFLFTADGGNALDLLAHENAGVIADGTYRIVSGVNDSKVLEGASGSKQDGANVQLFSWKGTNAQRWRVTHDASGYVTLTNVGSGKVLDVLGGVAAINQRVHQYEANGTAAQKWVVVDEGGAFTLYSAVGSGLVLDIAGGSTANGAKVQLFDSNATSAQRFLPTL